MPAKSKAQKNLFGLLYAYKKGEIKSIPKKLKKIADSMDIEDIKDFAKTKNKNLPDKIKECFLNKNVVLFEEYFS